MITSAELLANASDIDGDALSVTGLGIATGNGTLADNGDGTWTYTPAANDDTGVTFAYSVSDGTTSVAASATLDLTPVNDAPEVSGPVTLAASAEDTTRVITSAELLANASDIDGDALSVTGLSIATGNGTLADNGDGTWTYTPAANDDSDVTFAYSVSDGTTSVATTATLDLTPVNDAPTASAIDAGSVSEDDPAVTIDLLANASDVEGDTLSVSGISVTDDLGQGVAFTDNGDGTVIIDPGQYDALNAGQSRTLTVSYDVGDGQATTPTTVSLVVIGAAENQAPTAVDDLFQSRIYSPSTAQVEAAGNNNSIANAVDLSGLFELSPNSQVTRSGSNPHVTVQGTLSNSNDVDYYAFTVAEDNTALVFDIDGGGHYGVNNSGYYLIGADTQIAVYNAAGGHIAGNLDAGLANNDPGSGEGYNPYGLNRADHTADPFLQDTLDAGTYYVAVSGVRGTNGSYRLHISQADRGAAFDHYVSEDQATTFQMAELIGNDTDPDGDALTIQSLAASAGAAGATSITTALGATVTLNGDGSVSYDPTASATLDALGQGQVTTDSFWYTVSDGRGGTSTAQVTLDVDGVNYAPDVSGPVTLAPIAEDSGPVTITSAELLAHASDLDGDALSVTNMVLASGNGTLIDNGDGTWTYTPAADDDSSVTLSYRVYDGAFRTATSATMDLTPVNDAPVVSGPETLAALVEDTGPRTITSADLLANATDVEGDALSVSGLTISSGSGTLVDNGDGTWDFTPDANDDTGVTFSYTVSDGTASVAASATLDLTPVNDAPTLAAATFATSGGSLDLAAYGNDVDSDDDGASLNYAVVGGGSTGGSASISGSTFTFDPGRDFLSLAAGETATTSFTVEATDSHGATATNTVEVTVNGVNDGPVFVPSSAFDTVNAEAEVRLGASYDNSARNFVAWDQIAAGASTVITLPATAAMFADPEGDALTDLLLREIWHIGTDGAMTQVTGLADTLANFYPLYLNPSDNTLTIQMTGSNPDAVGYYMFSVDTQDSHGADSLDVAQVFLSVTHRIDGGGGSETLNGTAVDDSISGRGGADVIKGMNGNDLIDGGNGNDDIWGGNGNDTVLGGAGDDEISGGAGDDSLSGQGDNDSIRGDAGDDTLNGNDGQDTLYGGDGDDVLSGGNAVDTLYGDVGNDTLHGGGGYDDLNGGDGDDILYGDDGGDVLNGNDGNDILYSGTGDNYLNGGNGDDLLVVTSAPFANSLNGGAGNDTAMWETTGYQWKIDLAAGNTHIGQYFYGSLTSIENVIGSGSSDTITGNGVANILSGRNGGDAIAGGGGNDTLIGGLGDDTLTGDAGADVFVFDLGDGSDTITDFGQADGDLLYLSLALTGGETNVATILANHASASGGGIDLGFGAATIHLDGLNLTDAQTWLADQVVVDSFIF